MGASPFREHGVELKGCHVVYVFPFVCILRLEVCSPFTVETWEYFDDDDVGLFVMTCTLFCKKQVICNHDVISRRVFTIYVSIGVDFFYCFFIHRFINRCCALSFCSV